MTPSASEGLGFIGGGDNLKVSIVGSFPWVTFTSDMLITLWGWSSSLFMIIRASRVRIRVTASNSYSVDILVASVTSKNWFGSIVEVCFQLYFKAELTKSSVL